MIQKIRLTDFRNFRSKIFEFSPEITVIVGPNAIGKTNILESLFLLSTGKSFRARIEAEMINYEKDLARVKGRFLGAFDLEVILTRDLKKLLLNGVPKRLIDFAGNFKVVLFGPWDLDLVNQSPSLRRKFLDTVLSQVDREYRRSVLSYEKGLRQRNKLLFRIREEGLSAAQLLFWDQLLVKNGNYISEKRQEFIEFVNGLKKCNLKYDYSAISEGRLEQYKREEIAAATTLVGPHRDDMQFQITNSKLQMKRNLATYGSRGEQRMGVLWLKLAELAFIEEKTGEKPTLLLDDIFSELDHEHRKVVMDIVAGKPGLRQGFGGQAIITTADPHFVEEFKKVEKIELQV